MSSNPKADDPIWWAIFTALVDYTGSQETCEDATDAVTRKLHQKGFKVIKARNPPKGKGEANAPS